MARPAQEGARRRVWSIGAREVFVSGINSVQDQELTFLTGVTGQGLLAAQSFWTWNEDLPATYSSTESLQAKWGAPQAGTGGTINVAFDAASNWTATESKSVALPLG